MHSRNKNGWAGILGSEELADDHERTDPNVELPVFGAVGSEEPTRVARTPGRLTLPRPNSDRGSAPPALEFPVQVDELVQKLEPTEKKDTTARKKKDEAKLFTKEVVLTIIGGILILGGTLAYTHSEDEAPKLPAPTPVQALGPPAPVLQPKPAPKAPEPPPEEQQRKASTPILSILSSPSGARVEIDGTIYGSTPLIQPSPANVRSLSIRLLKDNFRPYEALLTPNEAGHFNLNATLEKR